MLTAGLRKVGVDMVRSYVHYDPSTGVFRCIRASGRRSAGSEIGSRMRKSVRLNFGGHFFPAHHVAWILSYGKWSEGPIDHINGNPFDNRLCNLREATVQLNNVNRRVQRNSKTQVKGVSLTESGRYRARMRLNGSRPTLGFFDTIEEAKAAYDSAQVAVHGEFARA